jgi:hypothetical protein
MLELGQKSGGDLLLLVHNEKNMEIYYRLAKNVFNHLTFSETSMTFWVIHNTV